ncbi:hypothetical protein STAS_14924, partial [Striga asiatica]
PVASSSPRRRLTAAILVQSRVVGVPAGEESTKPEVGFFNGRRTSTTTRPFAAAPRRPSFSGPNSSSSPFGPVRDPGRVRRATCKFRSRRAAAMLRASSLTRASFFCQPCFKFVTAAFLKALISPPLIYPSSHQSPQFHISLARFSYPSPSSKSLPRSHVEFRLKPDRRFPLTSSRRRSTQPPARGIAVVEATAEPLSTSSLAGDCSPPVVAVANSTPRPRPATYYPCPAGIATTVNCRAPSPASSSSPSTSHHQQAELCPPASPLSKQPLYFPSSSPHRRYPRLRALLAANPSHRRDVTSRRRVPLFREQLAGVQATIRSAVVSFRAAKSSVGDPFMDKTLIFSFMNKRLHRPMRGSDTLAIFVNTAVIKPSCKSELPSGVDIIRTTKIRTTKVIASLYSQKELVKFMYQTETVLPSPSSQEAKPP